MDSFQPAASFKLRGIGNMCQKEAKKGKEIFITSSGGNAGYAVAYSGLKLGVKVIVFVPETTPIFMRERIQSLGAKVIVAGKVWDEANQHALKFLEKEKTAVYIPPFDHPEIWEGNATLISEIYQDFNQMKKDSKPAAIICSVGGGGLFNGIVMGLQKVGWGDIPVVAVETEGADCFNLAIKAGKLVTKESITSVAKSLGALTVSAQSLNLTKTHKVISHVVSDAAACMACVNFADDHRILVEPACGASLAILYEKGLLKRLLPNLNKDSKVVVIVCGGQMCNIAQLESWAKTYASKL